MFNQAKRKLALLFDKIYLNSILHQWQVKCFSPFIRAINYHDVAPSEKENFERQLRYYANHFESVNYEDLQNFHQSAWNKNKPGLILTFDDGFRSCYDIIAPLLEKYGFTGWFLVPAGLLDVTSEKQSEQAKQCNVYPKENKDKRIFLSWEELAELDKRHIVGCHTLTHCRLKASLPPEKLKQEIFFSKSMLEKKLGHEIPVFAWVGGEEYSYSREAAQYIHKAGYKVVFLTNYSVVRPHTELCLIDRANVESYYPLELVKFHLSGFMDLYYTRKRLRVNRLIRSGYQQEVSMLFP